MQLSHTAQSLVLHRSVLLNGEHTGSIAIVSDLTGFPDQLLGYTKIAILVLITSLLATLSVAKRLLRIVSDPILRLSAVAAKVSMENQYILLVTAKDDAEDVVTGLEAGADDHLTKPFDRSELRARLRVGRRILTLQKGLIQAREELRFQATHDVLTGIWNRGALLDLLQREIERARRSQSPTGLLMLDLDHFKTVNDTYGHLAGDVVLREVARRISEVVRSYDLVGRYGGEEFLVVLPGCDKDRALQSAERIRSVIAENPVLAAGAEILVTASIGVTVTTVSTVAEKEILAIADTALYQAKSAGRNCTAAL